MIRATIRRGGLRVALALAAALVAASAWSAPGGLPDPVAPAAAAPAVAVAPDAAAPSPAKRRFHELEARSKARTLAKLEAARAAATPNQEQWDALSYDLELSLDPVARILQGTVGCRAVVTGPSLAALELDLGAAMTVSAASSGGLPVAFSHAGDLLTVDLDGPHAAGDTVEVTVSYAGNPASEYFGWSSYGGQPLIWTLSEPFGARRWWPCKDTPADKAATVDLVVTVPDGLIVASNGNLLSDAAAGGLRTFHWRESYPIATYLVSLAVHPYVVLHDAWEYAPGDTMPVVHYVVPDRAAVMETAYAVTVPMLQAFSEGFGLYPFVQEKYGHAHFPWGGGMEHQTLTSLYYGATQPWIIAHELAHQWWGDLVTCADFHDIWLNEGFATWSEAYWRERTEGYAGYLDEMSSNAYYGPGTVYVEDTSDFGTIFDYDLTYRKASWVVHMLRGVLGDDDFFAALAAWRQEHAYGSAHTEDLRAVCEQVSGLDLSWFFQEWLHQEYYPVYEYSWYAVAAGDSTDLHLMIRQAQTGTGLFTMPLDVRVLTDRGDFASRVMNSLADQGYVLTVAGTVSSVLLDPDQKVLKQAYQTLTGAPVPSPAAPALLPNRPNPFNPRTTIAYDLPRAADVLLTVHDLAGRRLRTLAQGRRAAGRHEAVWDGRDAAGRGLASGVYVCRLRAGEVELTRRMTLLK